MRLIPLSRNKHAIVDDIDFDLVNRFKWWLTTYGKREYAVCTMRIGFIEKKLVRATMKMHRLIMRPPRHLQVDHRNHNGLD